MDDKYAPAVDAQAFEAALREYIEASDISSLVPGNDPSWEAVSDRTDKADKAVSDFCVAWLVELMEGSPERAEEALNSLLTEWNSY